MAEDEHNPDQLFVQYWHALADDANAAPPPALPPTLARQLRQLTPPDPSADFVARLERALLTMPAPEIGPEEAPLLRAGLPVRKVRRLQYRAAPTFAMAAMLALLIVGAALLSAMLSGRSHSLNFGGANSATTILQKAEQVADGQFQPFNSVMVTETEGRITGGAPTRTPDQVDMSRIIQTWYQSADVWRMEFAGSSVTAGYSPQLLVSDGTEFWNYDLGGGVQIASLAQMKANRQVEHPLHNTVSIYNLDKCTPTLAGSDVVAGRVAYVVALGSSACLNMEGASSADDRWVVWIDETGYIELKAERGYINDGAPISYTNEVTSIHYDATIPPQVFNYRPPDGAKINDTRPNPGIDWLTLDEMRQRVSYPIFIPTYLPDGYIPSQPIMDNHILSDGSKPPDNGTVNITYHKPDAENLSFTSGPATTATRSEYLVRGRAVTLPNGIAAHLDEWSYPLCNGTMVTRDVMLYWEQAGALMQLRIDDQAGVTFSRDELFKIAASVSKDAALGETQPLPPPPTIIPPPQPTEGSCSQQLPQSIPTGAPYLPTPATTYSPNSTNL